MRSILLALAVPVMLAAAAPAQALEPFRIYDRFTERTIDPARWQDNERIRIIKGGEMQLMQRTWGLGGSDFGTLPAHWVSNLANPQDITALKARITVTTVETNGCPTNPAIGDARIRIFGTFFNVSTPTPGSKVNDVIAQVRLYRTSNTTDPAGLMHVQGILSICTTADCISATTVGTIIDLGTVMVGTPTTVSMQWDKPGKTFYFGREGFPTGTVAYSESDASPPSITDRYLSTRVTVPSCLSAPRVSATIDALFDNVFVNQSAAP